MTLEYLRHIEAINGKIMYTLSNAENTERTVVSVSDYKPTVYVASSDGEYTTTRGTKVSMKRVSVLDYKTLSRSNSLINSGVKPEWHYIKDNMDKFKYNTNFNFLFFDIETYNSLDTFSAPEPILSIAFYSTAMKKYFVYCLTKDDEKDATEVHEDKYDVKYFRDERELLKAFGSIIKQHDVISGWNSKTYDLPYFVSRCKRLNIDLSEISSYGFAYTYQFRDKSRNDVRTTAKICGISHIDAMEDAKLVLFWRDVKMQSFRLDAVSKEILGDSKVVLELSPAELYDSGRLKELVYYNFYDVKLLVEIDRVLGLSNMVLAKSSIVKFLNLEYIKYNSVLITNFIFMNYDIIAERSSEVRETKGGLVIEPKPGLYSHVAILDFSSMYPSIILTYNITESKYDILPRVTRQFMNLRASYKEMYKSAITEEDKKKYYFLQLAAKTPINSLFGVFGYRQFFLYDPVVANTITRRGRELLQYVRDYIDNNVHGAKTIYGDTDSVFVELADTVDKDMLVTSVNTAIAERVKADGCSNNYMKVELETFLDKLLLTPAKKKYIGVGKLIKGKLHDNAQLYFRGFELTKKDIPVAVKNSIRHIIVDYFNEPTVDTLLRSIYKEIDAMKSADVSDLYIYKEITRSFDSYKIKPLHVRAAEASNKYLHTNFSRSNYKGGMIYVKSSKYPDVTALLMDNNVSLPNEFEVDYDTYVKKFILGKISLIFSREISSKIANLVLLDKTQKTLSEFVASR